jgi:sugar phosphate isomerase/epimerase
MNRRTYCISTLFASAAAALATKPKGVQFAALGACSSLKNAEAIHVAGGQYVEESVQRLFAPDKPDRDWQARLEAVKNAELPIPACNSFIPGSLRSTGKDANHEAVLAYVDVAFKRAQQIGTGIIVFGSSGSRKLKEGDTREQAEKQMVNLLKKMGPLAESHGITVVIEPLRRQECNLINTVGEGAAIVERVNHPNVRLLFDIYHMLQNGEDPNDLRKVAPLLRHGHIAEKENRTAPGVKGDDFRPFFNVLADIGYTGRLSIEGKWKPEDLPRAYQVIREQARG